MEFYIAMECMKRDRGFYSCIFLLHLFMKGLTIGAYIGTTCNFLTLYKMSLLILPHGIFEIPAIIIAGIAGFKIP